jgi:transcriptional regulator
MYRPSFYVVDDVPVLHDIVRKRAFATIATVSNGEVAFAYAPVVLAADPKPFGALRFHLARANPLATMDAAKIRMIFAGSDAYVSPDWYGAEGFVPTWNYIAIEASGVVERLGEDDLQVLLDDLSAQQEARLLPKKPWTLDKLPEEKVAQLLHAIVGFRVRLETLEGKFKLSQDKKPEMIAGVIAALERSADPADHAVAAAMRRYAGKTE